MTNQANGNIGLSVIIPAYNEEQGLDEVVGSVLEDGRARNLDVEIIIVDDGSKDNTRRIAARWAGMHPNIRVVAHDKNLGVGAAILSGTQAARKEFVTYIPADGQVFLRDIDDGIKKAKDTDLVLTYRPDRGDYTIFRRILSIALTSLMKLLFGLRYKDYNWVHIYRRKIFDVITPKSSGVFFLSEIVIRAKRFGFKIEEARSVYRPRTGGKSKISNVKVALGTLKDLFKIWMELNLHP